MATLLKEEDQELAGRCHRAPSGIKKRALLCQILPNPPKKIHSFSEIRTVGEEVCLALAAVGGAGSSVVNIPFPWEPRGWTSLQTREGGFYTGMACFIRCSWIALLSQLIRREWSDKNRSTSPPTGTPANTYLCGSSWLHWGGGASGWGCAPEVHETSFPTPVSQPAIRLTGRQSELGWCPVHK